MRDKGLSTAAPHAALAVLERYTEPGIELAIAAWLHQKHGRSESERTRRAYEDTLTRYRAMLRAQGYDLDTLADEDQARAVELLTQAWAAEPRPDGKSVAASTYNLRLNIVSSFYVFARKRRLLRPGIVANPTVAIDRRPSQEYASARPLDATQVRERLDAIDVRTPVGMRDYALMLVALTTGRRLSELAGLTFEDVEYVGGEAGHERIKLTWPRAKGGKVMRDALSRDVAQALLAWLRWRTAHIEVDHTRVWVSLSHNGTLGKPLGIQSIEDACQRRLGVSKVHALRHTFAHEMEDAGAPISVIQARLGHSSLAVTGRYLAQMRSDENAYAEELARMFTGKQ